MGLISFSTIRVNEGGSEAKGDTSAGCPSAICSSAAHRLCAYWTYPFLQIQPVGFERLPTDLVQVGISKRSLRVDHHADRGVLAPRPAHSLPHGFPGSRQAEEDDEVDVHNQYPVLVCV